MNTIYLNKYEIVASTVSPNPATSKYWADLSTNPYGGDLKYFNGGKNQWFLVNQKASDDITVLRQDLSKEITRATNKENELSTNKVDKVSGKGLSTNDYTTAEKNKLAGLVNYNDKEVRDLIANLTLELNTLKERVAALETPAA